MNFPFEFCAFRFLIQWLQKEEELHSRMQAVPTLADLRDALKYFQVARCFTGIRTAKGGKALDALLKVRHMKNLSPEGQVDELARRFAADFNNYNLSAASKMLWLSSRSPFIVYDSRAVAALKRQYKCKFDDRSYAQYCASWRSKFSANERQIANAVKRLPAARPFMPGFSQSDSALLTMVKADWFKERVFDIHLWETGRS